MIHSSLSLEQWGEVWAAALWRASWQGAIVLAAVWAIARWCRFVSPRITCWLWRFACLKLLVALFWAQPVLLRVLPVQAEAPIATKVAARSAPPLVAGESPVRATEIIELEQPMISRRSRPPRYFLLALLWLAGMLGSVGVTYKHWRSVGLLLASAVPDGGTRSNEACRVEAARLGVRRPPRLLLSEKVDSPLLAGVWRPAIVLPVQAEERFDAVELRLMLAHELAHYRRRDLVWNWLPIIVRAVFFFHPLVWLMSRRWSVTQESACDELLLQNGVARPAEYGRLLLKLARRENPHSRPTLAAAGVLGAYRNLEQRIMAMTRVRPFSRRRLITAASAFLLLTASSLVPWRLVPRLAVAAEPANHKPVAKQVDTLPGKIYVWAALDLSSEADWPHNYRGLIEIDPNTGEWRKIGALGQFYRISPDGQRIAFSDPKPRWSRDGTQTTDSEILIADLAGPRPAKLIEEASLRTWSPDGHRLLYHVHDGSEGWYGTSWLFDLDSRAKRKLPIAENDQVEDWTAHGDWLVAISARDVAVEVGYQVYVMHPDGSGQRRVTRGTGGNLEPRFSPDGKQIVYVHSTRDEDSLWITDIDGANARQMFTASRSELSVAAACWSPDGRWLAAKMFENINGPPEERRMALELIAAADGKRRSLRLKDVTVIHFLQNPDWR